MSKHLFPFLLFQLCIPNLLSQNLEAGISKSISYNAGGSVFQYEPSVGFILLSKSDDNNTQVTIFNEKLEKIKTQIADHKLLNYRYNGYINQNGTLHFIFDKSSYIGLRSHGKLYTLKVTSGSATTYKYRMPGMPDIAAITADKNSLIFWGAEVYKKWTVPRAMKFLVSPFTFGTILLLPTKPSTRPVICRLNNGTVNHLYRQELKGKEYKNKIIHQVYSNRDGSYWVGMTNGYQPGNSPVYIQKYSADLELTSNTQYNSSAKTRISHFKFYDSLTNQETARFIVGFGEKAFSSSMIKRNNIHVINELFEGQINLNSKNSGSLKTYKRKQNEFISADDAVQRNVSSAVQKQVRLSFRGDQIEVLTSCWLYPLKESNGGIIGYYFSPTYITVHNLTSGKITNHIIHNPDPDKKDVKETNFAQAAERQRVARLGHYVHTSDFSRDITHSAVTLDSTGIYISYITPTGELNTYDISGTKIKEVGSTQLQPKNKKNDDDLLQYKIVTMNESSFAVLAIKRGGVYIGSGAKPTNTSIHLFKQK